MILYKKNEIKPFKDLLNPNNQYKLSIVLNSPIVIYESLKKDEILNCALCNNYPTRLRTSNTVDASLPNFKETGNIEVIMKNYIFEQCYCGVCYSISDLFYYKILNVIKL